MKTIALVALLAVFVAQTGCADGSGSTSGSGTVACSTRADCSQPDNPCMKPLCTSGVCGSTPAPEGTSIADAAAGDCKAQICDGAGNIMATNDDTDIPNDGNSCTNDACTNGIPSNAPVAAAAPCSEGGGSLCNGAGACVECVAVDDCPGQDTACQVRSCVAGICGTTLVAAGTPIASQTDNDCQINVCDGFGLISSAPDNADVPIDGNTCTADTCTAGVPSNPPLPIDSPCTENGGKVCNANAACVQCNVANQCSTGVCSGNVCQPPSCVDSVTNGAETDIDCGGAVCSPCAVGKECQQATDCSSGVCTSFVCMAPKIVSTKPADGETSVAIGAAVSVLFTGAMNPASLDAQLSAGPCIGSVQLSTDGFATCLGFASASPMMSAGNSVAAWIPAPALSYGSTYFVRVTTVAEGADGTPINTTYSSNMGFTTKVPTTSCNGALVISQIYGNGGNPGATFKNDFIEIHNRGNVSVNLSGWSVQYASATGTTWLVTTLTGSIAAGGYYLVQGAGGTIGAVLPTPNATGMTNMSSSAGKVALVQATAALSGACPVGLPLVDFVGFGPTANCFEGAGASTAAAATTQSMQRSDAGCIDTDDNKLDFTVASALPRNTMSSANMCPCTIQGAINESGIAAEIDLCNIQSPTSMTVKTLTTTPTIYGHVFETGFTEAAGANAIIFTEVGYGPGNINPTTQSGWLFFPTVFGMQIGNADEYRGSFTAPAVGSYRYAYRASLDGLQWTYCDLNDAGSNSGAIFEVTQLPILTVTP